LAGLAIALGAIVLLSACVVGPDASVATPQHPAQSASASGASAQASANQGESPSPQPQPSTDENAPHGFATRLVIPFLDVDLPVIAGIMDAAGNPEFPLCDVAQYLPYYVQPGAPGTTYLYAHARRGMLGEMLAQSLIDDGAEMLGEQVVVYTSGGWRHTYSISIVKPHATDYSIADEVAPDEERLVLQTSEGTVENPLKLQVAAEPVSSTQVPASEALASPEPRDCAPG
jgi:hypothetical protein